MARSKRIYLVYHDPDATMPLAAFTVKHEAITFFKRENLNKEEADIYAGPDGSTGEWIKIQVPD